MIPVGRALPTKTNRFRGVTIAVDSYDSVVPQQGNNAMSLVILIHWLAGWLAGGREDCQMPHVAAVSSPADPLSTPTSLFVALATPPVVPGRQFDRTTYVCIWLPVASRQSPVAIERP